jgi:hypothetical protein
MVVLAIPKQEAHKAQTTIAAAMAVLVAAQMRHSQEEVMGRRVKEVNTAAQVKALQLKSLERQAAHNTQAAVAREVASTVTAQTAVQEAQAAAQTAAQDRVAAAQAQQLTLAAVEEAAEQTMILQLDLADLAAPAY